MDAERGGARRHVYFRPRNRGALLARRGVAAVVAGGPSRPVGRAGKSADWHDGNWRPRRRRTDWSTESSRESAVGVEQ
ncbi:unnamed protein product [Ixodes pacificus]